MINNFQGSFVFGLIVCIFTVGCSSGDTDVELPVEGSPTETVVVDGEVNENGRLPVIGLISQWASEGEGSSEFSNFEWSAEQVIGEPDSPGCGDYQFSWASAASDSIDTLTVRFPVPVFPLEIIIHESFNPDQVVKVEIQDPESGGFYTVLQKNPIQVDRPCPYELTVPVEGIKYKSNTIRITVDQSQLGLGWNEIDAVQLIGSQFEQ